MDRTIARRAYRASTLVLTAGLAAAGCTKSGSSGAELAELTQSVKFDSQTYGVPASPRLSAEESTAVRDRGGRSQVGKPYKVKGRWYYPKDEPGYTATGKASWYGPNFDGRLTANGEVYDMTGLSAAHKTFPLPSYAMVTNRENGNRLLVRVNDRGPFSREREIDVSRRAAKLLGFKEQGTADVSVDYVGRAPLKGDDTSVLLASFEKGRRSAAPTTRVAAGPESTDIGRADYAAAYAPAHRDNARHGAAGALDSLARSPRIALGLIDPEILARVEQSIGDETALKVDRSDGAGRLTGSIALAEGADTDALLERLWSAGAEDAFVVRD